MESEISEPEMTSKPSLLSRKNLYLGLALLSLLPLLIALFFGPTFFFLLVLTLTLFVQLVGSFVLFRLWEERMRLSVGALVAAKVGKLQPTQGPLVDDAQLKLYQDKIEELKAHLDEMQRGYEHQVDLLHASLSKSKEQYDELFSEIEKKQDDYKKITLALGDVRQEYNRLKEEREGATRELEERLEHKEAHIADYQHTIAEQRVIIEKKQRYITKLEIKVRDLMYEIRSLLQLEEGSPALTAPTQNLVEFTEPAPEQRSAPEAYIQPPAKGLPVYDLSIQLQRYVEIAEQFTGADHLAYVGGKTPRFLDISYDNYAIDLRRLFDHFRDESGGVIFLYSLSEQKFLFVGSHVKMFLGWSPEKFMKDFNQILVQGADAWKQGLAKIPTLKEAKIQLVLRNRQNDELLFHCFLARITSGPFYHHVIGIFSPVE